MPQNSERDTCENACGHTALRNFNTLFYFTSPHLDIMVDVKLPTLRIVYKMMFSIPLRQGAGSREEWGR